MPVLLAVRSAELASTERRARIFGVDVRQHLIAAFTFSSRPLFAGALRRAFASSIRTAMEY
jgi:hypothetical protein